MKLEEYRFHDYYRKFMIVEADDLTERLKDEIAVSEDDCFMLCTSYVNREGQLVFPVLAIGEAKEKCSKGLRRKKMLGRFATTDLLKCEVTFIEPTFAMLEKTDRLLVDNEEQITDEIAETRSDRRLDDVRDPDYPDIVYVGLVTTLGIQECPMKLICFEGPFVEGRLDGEFEIKGLKGNDYLRALPYNIDGTFRLLSIFVGDTLSEEEETAFRDLVDQGNEAGFGFSSHGLKS